MAPVTAAWGRDRRASGVEESREDSAGQPAATAEVAGAGGGVNCARKDEDLLPGNDGGAPEYDHDTAAGRISPGPTPAMGVAQRGEEVEEREGLQEEEEGREEEEEIAEDEEISGRDKDAFEEDEEDDKGRPVADMIVLEPESSQAAGIDDLIRLPGEAAAEEDTSAPGPERPTVPATATATVVQTAPTSTPASGAGVQRKPRQADGGAEAGAGSERVTPAHALEKPPPAGTAAPSGASREEENISAGRNSPGTWERGKENGPIDGAPKGDERRDKAVVRKKRAAGLWELKAERGRLDNALAEAENERDVQRARAMEAADRLEEAIARLEGLRQRLEVDGGGGLGGGVG